MDPPEMVPDSGTYSITDYIQENSRIQQEAVSDKADNRENTKRAKSETYRGTPRPSHFFVNPS